jgi:deoxyribodipyrimidine photo-lyase
MPSPVLLWFRRDLRLQDNAAVAAAKASGAPIIPVYIHDETLETRPMGAASKWWLNKSLHVLDEELKLVGSRLIVMSGDATVILLDTCNKYDVKTVYSSRIYEPVCEENDRDRLHELSASKIRFALYDGALISEPGAVKTQDNRPYKVFTPFFKALQTQEGMRQPKASHEDAGEWRAPDVWPESLHIEDLHLHPAPTRSGADWSVGFDRFTPGERGARKALRRFLREGLADYRGGRDRPDLNLTSHLSPHLRFGEISPHRILIELDKAVAVNPRLADSAAKFRAELAWRDFSYNLLHQQPRLHEINFRDDFDAFPWRDDTRALHAWRRGETGYDLVDAGMKELWATGYMHNRVRMVVASFLVKHLLIDWREGEAWFWDCLLDADPANNPASWQWVSGCGADAAPYFRIFNPMTQAAKFDPEGVYRARWLGGDLDSYVRADKAGQPNADPRRRPIVDHAQARQRALDAYQNREGSHADHEPD